MDINEWFEKGCDYQAGVLIYGQLKSHRSNLLRLFMRKQNAINQDKLKYELGKHRTESPKNKPTPPPSGANSDPVTKVETPAAAPVQSESSKKRFYRLNELHTDLHQMAIEQRNNFQLAVAAHHQLVKLHADEEGESLKIQLYIEELFDAIDTAQKVLDHYVKHKVVLKTEARTYEDLNAPQLIQARKNKRASVSKYRKKVQQLEEAKPENKSAKNKQAVELQKANEKLLKHEMDLRKLDELIAKYE